MVKQLLASNSPCLNARCLEANEFIYKLIHLFAGSGLFPCEGIGDSSEDGRLDAPFLNCLFVSRMRDVDVDYQCVVIEATLVTSTPRGFVVIL